VHTWVAHAVPGSLHTSSFVVAVPVEIPEVSSWALGLGSGSRLSLAVEEVVGGMRGSEPENTSASAEWGKSSPEVPPYSHRWTDHEPLAEQSSDLVVD
jgi:hypothetical protein